MGTSTSGAQLSRKLVAFAGDIPKINRQAVSDAALIFKDGVLGEAKKVVGSDLKMSNFGKRGVRLGAGFDVKGGVNAVALLKARPMGPWKVVEYGAGPHLIGLGKAGRTESVKSKGRAYRKAKGNYLYGQGYAHPVRGPIAHPGSKGFKPWSRGITTRQPRAVQRIRLAYASGAMRRFGPTT